MNNDDLISRQAAIDAVADYIHNVDKVIGAGHLSADDCKDAAKSVLDELPSAQPELSEADVQKMQDLEQAEIQKAYELGKLDAMEEIKELSFTHKALDTISRQAAIDTLNEYFERIGKLKRKGLTKGEKAISLDTVGAIKTLPSAQPEIEPKTGHWIEEAKTYYEELKKRSLGVDEYTPYFTDDIACSECLAKYSVLDNETQFFKYCPNCGAKMERGWSK